MFSHRVPSDHSANRMSAALERMKRDGVAVIDLTESNPTRCGFRQEERLLLDALSLPGSLRYEPHPQGLASARDAVARYYDAVGVRVHPDDLFLTTGTSEAYSQVFKLLADPGDEIMVPRPGYPLLDVLTRLEAVHLLPYQLELSGGWRMNVERLRAAMSTRTRAVVVVSPNNPTGSFLKQGELEELNAVCRDLGCALIVDEVFSDYGLQTDPGRVRTAAGNTGALTFTLNGFSKLVGMPQLKLGWVHVSGPTEEVRRAKERLAFVTDAYLSVSAAVQHAAPAIFSLRTAMQKQIVRRLEENRDALARGLSEVPGCRVLPIEGGWYAVVEIPGAFSDEDLVLELLEGDGVLVHPGYLYDFIAGQYLVVSLLPAPEGFQAGVSRLARRLSRVR